MKSVLAKALHPLRVMAGRFAISTETNYTGAHGCLKTGASFVSWNQVEGDYLEFGVFRGDSLAAAYHALEKERALVIAHSTGTSSQGADEEFKRWAQTPPRMFAFDSFEGLPGGDGTRQVDYGQGAYSASENVFRNNVAAQGVDLNRVISVPGFYDKSLTPEVKKKHNLRKASLVMIDCDLYESTVPVMNFLTDIVTQGTVLVFHDWFRFKGSPKQGEQRACREWLQRNPHLELIEYWKEGPQAIAFLVNFR